MGSPGKDPPRGSRGSPGKGVSWPGFLLVSTQDLASTELRVAWLRPDFEVNNDEIGQRFVAITQYCVGVYSFFCVSVVFNYYSYLVICYLCLSFRQFQFSEYMSIYDSM